MLFPFTQSSTLKPCNRVITTSRRVIAASLKTAKATSKMSNNDTLLCNKLAILGGGKMAESILNALKSKKIIPMEKVQCYDINPSRMQALKKAYKIQTSVSNEECIDGADIVILAVKPQNVTAVAESIKKPVTGTLISILAGVSMSQLRENFNTEKVIRTMPNTPAMVLEGITVWCASPETSPEVKVKAQILLSSFGEEVEVSEEPYLDMATAVSGSGPAYVFLTMEAMIDASVHLGFPRATATKLVTATMRGSAIYSKLSEEELTTLRNNVTSPGGTTASALYELERGGFRTVVADAIWSAYRRSLELGNKDSNVGPGRSKSNSNNNNK